jgi:flagellar protein FlbD
MIPIHRLTHPEQRLLLNPDHIQMVESTPDTVVLLASGARLVVMETPEEIADRVRQWRASVARISFDPGEESSGRARLAAVVAGPGLAGTVPSDVSQG